MTARCPTCQTLRPADASYCPKCGTPLVTGRGPEPSPATDDDRTFDEVRVGPQVFDLSVWTGVKLGVGFIIGVGLVGAIVFLLVAIAVTTALR